MTKKKLPLFFEGGSVSAPKDTAGGASAIISSAKEVYSRMNLARGTKLLLSVNQKSGFDCPGCAWPDPLERSVTEFCENGAKAIAEEATQKTITPQFFARYSVNDLLEKTDFWLGQQGRLTEPMVRRENSNYYEKISWEEAYLLIKKELHALSSVNEAVFYTSGRTSNEAAFLYQLFVRQFGTNNLPDCSNMCHESSGVALKESIGVGKGTVSLNDFSLADCIVVMGQNPGTNHPRMLTSLENAAKRGCHIISINPLKEAGVTKFKHPQNIFGLFGRGTTLATHHVPITINGDLAFLKGVIKELFTHEKQYPKSLFDHDFINNFTVGYEDFIKDIEETDWERIVDQSGVSHEVIKNIAEVIGSSKRLIICWAMGLTQHKNAVATIQTVVNLLLLFGHFGRPGAGACPVRGHSNVQGDRTMGISENMPEAFIEKLEKEFSFTAPRTPGFDTVRAIKAMHEGYAKVFFGLGGNFLSATPDTAFVSEALQRCALTVHVSTKLNRAHLITGKLALILPCLGRTEIDRTKAGRQFVTVENSMGVVSASAGSLKPISPQLKSEVAIVCELAQVVLKNSAVDWSRMAENYHYIRDAISRVVPGFERFNEKINNSQGFSLYHPVRDDRRFITSTGKAHFKVHPLTKNSLPAGRYLLMTIRSHDQFNTTIYGLNDRYRGIKKGRKVLFMNEDDIKKAGFEPGSVVDIDSHFLGKIRTVYQFTIVPYAIPKQCLAAYFPETNALVPIDSTAEISNTPTYKSIEVSLRLHSVTPKNISVG